MNKILLNILLATSIPLSFAEGTKTSDPLDVAVSQVAAVYNLKHKLSSENPKKPVFDDLRVLISERDGTHTNTMGTLYLVIPGTEDGVEEGAIHKVPLAMSFVASVKNRWVNADNSSAGGYLFVTGRRMDPVKNVARAYSVTIKYTDSTNVYLSDLEVTEGYADKK